MLGSECGTVLGFSLQDTCAFRFQGRALGECNAMKSQAFYETRLTFFSIQEPVPVSFADRFGVADDFPQPHASQEMGALIQGSVSVPFVRCRS